MDWTAGDELDFGDEDDVGALLAKARLKVPPSRGTLVLSQRSNEAVKQQLADTSHIQTTDSEKLQTGVDVRRLLGERRATISSGSIAIKQQISSFAPQALRTPEQPLANVTNVRQHASSLQKKTPNSTEAFKAHSCVPETETPNSSGLRPGVPGSQRTRRESAAHVRTDSNERAQQTSSTSTSSCRLSQPSAAERGKQLLSGSLDNVGTDSPEIRQQGQRPTKIPGPAGAVQRALAQGRSSAEAHFTKPQNSSQASHFQEDEDFCRGPWLAALAFDRAASKAGPVQVSHLRDIRKGTSGRRIAQLVVIVKSLVPTGEGDVFVTVKDPTGTLEGTLHRKILADKQIGSITVGTALILKQVAVFRPIPRTCYLNITATNVLKVFPSKTPIPALPTFSSGSQRFPDPGLSEPNWEDRTGSPRSAGLVQDPSATRVAGRSSFCSFTGSPLSTASVEPSPIENRESVGAGSNGQSQTIALERQQGCAPDLLQQGREPLQPAQAKSNRHSGEQPCDRAQQAPSKPLSSFLDRRAIPQPCTNSETLQEMSDRQAGASAFQSAEQRRGQEVESLDSRRERLSSKSTAADFLHLKRGRENDLQSSDERPKPGAAAPARGPVALSEDIQQLLAGLDDEDWFLTGDDVPPNKKKQQEIEEPLPF